MTPPPLPRPPRRSPFSFLRSLFFSSPPADSFVPAHSSPPPKSFFDRLFRKSPRTHHHPGSEIQLSFFDDADTVRRALSPRLSTSRRTDSARTAHSVSRLSSAFAHTSPDLSSDSYVAPVSFSIAEKRDTLRSNSQTDLVSELLLFTF